MCHARRPATQFPSVIRPCHVQCRAFRAACARWRGGPVQQEHETGYTAAGARASRP